jgi:hypothetical protein
MFANAASATDLLKCCGHAEPRTLVGSSSVPVIIAAALAMASPICHISLIFE